MGKKHPSYKIQSIKDVVTITYLIDHNIKDIRILEKQDRKNWIEIRCSDCNEVLSSHPNQLHDNKAEWVFDRYIPHLKRSHTCKGGNK